MEEGYRNTYRVYYTDLRTVLFSEKEELIRMIRQYIKLRFKGRNGCSWIYRSRANVWIELVLDEEKAQDGY